MTVNKRLKTWVCGPARPTSMTFRARVEFGAKFLAKYSKLEQVFLAIEKSSRDKRDNVVSLCGLPPFFPDLQM